MRALKRCPHCEEVIPAGMIISWGQQCISRKRRKPPDEEADAPSGQNDAPKADKPDAENLIREEVLAQLPASGMADLSMTNEEIRTMALSLYQQALDDPQARKYILQLHLLSRVNHDVAVECSYYTGAWHALMVVRSRQPAQGKN